MKLILLNTLFLFFPLFIFSQGTISGTLLDATSGEPLMFANVVIKGTNIGSETDIEGKYQFRVEEGTYTMMATYLGYNDKEIEGIEVKDNELTYLDFILDAESVKLDQVVVKAKIIERSENALLLMQLKSDKIQNGISSQEMNRYSVSNAAGAMKKVSGATVSEGKYIYIRGLGDRYSLTQLNDLIIPSSNPYRNGAQLDLIPASLLENIVTAKTFTPDQPGIFTGGNVNLKTKSIPEQFFVNLSTSIGYNAQNNLIDNFLSYEGGSQDYWGYDDGTRSRPKILSDSSTLQYLNISGLLTSRLNIGDNGLEAAQSIDEATKSLNNDFSNQKMSTPVDHSFGISMGTRVNLFNNPLGLIFSSNFRESYQHLNSYRRANWRLENGEVQNQGEYLETLSEQNPTVNGIAGLAYKISSTHEISFNAIYNHNSKKYTRYLYGERQDNLIDPRYLVSHTLGFNEREMFNFQLGGQHVIKQLNALKFQWKASKAQSSLTEPDLKFFEHDYDIDFDTYNIPLSDVQEPFHFFRDLQDEQLDLKLDITLPIGNPTQGNKIKLGGMLTRKERNFKEWRYQIKNNLGVSKSFTGDIDAYLDESNLGIKGKSGFPGGYDISNYVVDTSLPENNYSGSEDVEAVYAMFSQSILQSKLKVIAGARYETTKIMTASESEFIEKGEIDDADILPSVNLIYNLKEKMNLRAAFSKTIARPNMREVAPFVAYDPALNSFYLGNPELKKTSISNYDLRWEWFFGNGEILALSSYYKDLKDPITQFFRKAPSPEIQFTNVEKGTLYGFEFELRKNLGFLSSGSILEKLKVSTNLSLIESKSSVIDLTGLEPEERPFEGQPPYIINFAFIYEDQNSNFDAVLSLNTQGDRLNIIGQEGTPDIYLKGRSQLDFSLSKKFGPVNLKINLRNLSNSEHKSFSEDEDNEYIYYQFKRGISYGLGISYTVK